jgi:hypothetical protein
MLNQYLLEFMGSLIISYALIFTHENPLIVGFAHTSVLYIAKSSNLDGHFTPISVILQLLLQRLDIVEGLKIIGIHILGAASIVLIYLQR